MSKPLKLVVVLSLIFIGVISLIHRTHPILLGWLSGTVRTIGKPINAKVYIDGHLNGCIKVYRDNVQWDGSKENSYILNLQGLDKNNMLTYIYIDVNNKWIGRPVGVNKNCYDSINETLFQNEVGAHFVDFRDDMKGFNFDPHLIATNTEIRFNIPPGQLKFTSVTVSLN